MNMEGSKSYLGVIAPISTHKSNDREKEVTITLMEELRRQNTFESAEEAATREPVLGRVDALVKKFVRNVSLKRGLSEAEANAAGGKIFTFGSYRLGVHGPGTEIDTLCVVPKHVSREDLFEVFEPMLKEMEGATEVAGIPEAYVPIITANISGIPVDFSIACLALSSIPDDLSLQDDNLLRNIDERCLRSLNDSRVANEVLRLIPDVEVFRNALRCIKLWATRRAIYSNVNGFFGGIAWTILVARICQLYPNAVAGAIVSRFFIIMFQWAWPQPVLLKPIEEGPLQVKVWNPKLYPADRAHRMPIITPAYPSMCATYNVTQSTQMITTEEFKRASEIVDRVFVGSASWSELFAKHDFFHKYRYYLQVIASTGDAELQIKWAGTVESRIRKLVMKLEEVDSLILAHPFIKGFDRVSYCLSDDEMHMVAQGDISDAIAKRTKQDIEGKDGCSVVYSTTFYIGLALEPKQPGLVGPRRLDISYPTTEFTKLVKMWEKYDDLTMGIVVRHIKSSGLPDNVFGPGERQPKSAQKRSKGKKPAIMSSSKDTGDTSLLELLDLQQLNCLNESAEHPFQAIVESKKRNTTSAFLQSDADERLLLNIAFNQAVCVHSIVIQTDELSLAPKKLKLVVNRSNVGFDELDEPDHVAHVLELRKEEVKEGKQVALRFERFQKVNSLHIFVVSNHGGEDETRIDKIDVFGVPVKTTKI